MSTGELATAPIWDDVASLNGARFSGAKPDIIYGGFPCQDISLAGLRAGLAGNRSGLFFQIIRLAQELKPRFIFLENVPGIRTSGLGQVVRSLAEAGYDCRYGFLSAEELGADHKRERWFLLAHARSEGPQGVHKKVGQKHLQSFMPGPTKPGYQSKWLPEPDVARVVNGLPFRMDRTKALGNAVVPAQAREAFFRLLGAKD